MGRARSPDAAFGWGVTWISRLASLGATGKGAATVARRLRGIFSGSVGNLVEWFDFYIYNSFAIYFAKQFSSSTDPTAQFLNIYGIYAIAFLVRPLGGVLLGNYADTHGRRSALTLSVVLMCAASLMIAVIPTYAQVGAAAPALLLVARLVQGLSLGGEYAASATYLSEVAGSRHRGFYSSFQYVTLIGGQVLAALLLIVMQQRLTDAELEAWAGACPSPSARCWPSMGFTSAATCRSPRTSPAPPAPAPPARCARCSATRASCC